MIVKPLPLAPPADIRAPPLRRDKRWKGGSKDRRLLLIGSGIRDNSALADIFLMFKRVIYMHIQFCRGKGNGEWVVLKVGTEKTMLMGPFGLKSRYQKGNSGDRIDFWWDIIRSCSTFSPRASRPSSPRFLQRLQLDHHRPHRQRRSRTAVEVVPGCALSHIVCIRITVPQR